MDLIGGIFILAVASLILTSICMGFIICGVIVLWRRDERKPKGMAEVDAEAESGRKSIPQANGTQGGNMLTPSRMAGYSIALVGFTLLASGLAKLDIDYICISVVVMIVGFLGMFLPQRFMFKRKAK